MHRILLTTIDFPPRRGGVARYLDALAAFLGDRVTVLAAPEPGSDAHDSAAPYRVEREVLMDRRMILPWLRTMELFLKRRATYDLALVSHVLPVGTAAWFASAWTRKPYAVIVHGMDVRLAGRSRRKRWLAGKVLRGAALVIANSKSLAQEVARDYGVKRLAVCHPPAAPAARESAPAPGRLLSVARLVPRKGHLRVLDALARLKARGDLGEISYRIVGSGPTEGEIRAAVDRLGLSGVVTLDTAASDEALAEAYASADALVLPVLNDPLDKEGFGMVYLEAATYGVPSVATDMDGVNEAVLDGETGILVPDGDLDALADALQRLTHDRPLRDRLGAAAKARAARDFTPARQFSALDSLL